MRPSVLRSLENDDEGDLVDPLLFLEVPTEENERALHVARRFVWCFISGGLARQRHERCGFARFGFFDDGPAIVWPAYLAMQALKLGRASCRERVCQDV